MSDLTVPLFALVDGFALIAIAVFAHVIGIDSNSAWGASRFMIFIAGTILTILSAWKMVANKTAAFLDPFLKSEPVKISFAVTHLGASICIIYIWFITYGTFTAWNHTSQYYTRLADAFERGHTYVDINPGTLLKAANPYDPKTRLPFQDDIWDMSYYKGKLYYYWGAVPAVMIVPIQSFLNVKVPDNFLVFFFCAGLLIFNYLLILKLWRIFFPNLPAKNVVATLPVIGLILPMVWVTSVPYIYEAAVAAGQFFFMGGMYFLISALENKAAFSRGRLFLAGLFLAATVESRAIYAPSVVLIALALSYWIVKNTPAPGRWGKVISLLRFFFVPLGIGAVVIGWYNWIRFGSPLEFGLKYQITTYDLNGQANLIFRPDYFFLNLYSYLLQPFEIISKFPFIQPIAVSDVLAGWGITPPYLYYAGRVTGIIFGAPFLLLGLIPVFKRPSPTKREADEAGEYQIKSLTIFLLAGSFVIEFGSLLFYFTAHTRFLMDVISQFTLLAIIGYWTLASNALVNKTKHARSLLIIANGLIVFTICAGLLLAFTGETNRMETLNPTLFQFLTR